MALTHLPATSRPRERLLAQGASTLADSELLAILLRTGMAGKNVLQLAQELLDAFGGFAGLLNARLEELQRVKGLGGNAKRAQLAAVLEIARRVLAVRLKERAVMESPAEVKDYLRLHLAARPYEVFAVLFLDSQNRLIVMEELFRGTLSQASVYPREVVMRALHHEAASVLLAHNHPSGCVQPSNADVLLTQALDKALQLIDVRVLDHVVVARGEAVSMAQLGLL